MLGCVGVRDSLPEAIDAAYEIAGAISFEGAFYRHDIGRRAMAALEEK